MKKIRAGFTIVEILVGLVLLSFIVASLITFIAAFQAVARKSSQKLIAVNLARETMEKLYWEYPLTETASPQSDPLLPNAIKWAATADRTYTITNDPTGNYMIIEVTVEWT